MVPGVIRLGLFVFNIEFLIMAIIIAPLVRNSVPSHYSLQFINNLLLLVVVVVVVVVVAAVVVVLVVVVVATALFSLHFSKLDSLVIIC
jgi:hypothetical protein